MIYQPFILQCMKGQTRHISASNIRASSRATPLQLLVGDVAISGFVVSFGEDVIDAASSLTQWTVTMAMLPLGPVLTSLPTGITP